MNDILKRLDDILMSTGVLKRVYQTAPNALQRGHLPCAVLTVPNITYQRSQGIGMIRRQSMTFQIRVLVSEWNSQITDGTKDKTGDIISIMESVELALVKRPTLRAVDDSDNGLRNVTNAQLASITGLNQPQLYPAGGQAPQVYYGFIATLNIAFSKNIKLA